MKDHDIHWCSEEGRWRVDLRSNPELRQLFQEYHPEACANQDYATWYDLKPLCNQWCEPIKKLASLHLHMVRGRFQADNGHLRAYFSDTELAHLDECHAGKKVQITLATDKSTSKRRRGDGRAYAVPMPHFKI